MSVTYLQEMHFSFISWHYLWWKQVYQYGYGNLKRCTCHLVHSMLLYTVPLYNIGLIGTIRGVTWPEFALDILIAIFGSMLSNVQVLEFIHKESYRFTLFESYYHHMSPQLCIDVCCCCMQHNVEWICCDQSNTTALVFTNKWTTIISKNVKPSHTHLMNGWCIDIEPFLWWVCHIINSDCYVFSYLGIKEKYICKLLLQQNTTISLSNRL